MINRKKKLPDLLGDLWSMDLTIDDVLHYCTLMGFARCVVEPQIKPVFAMWDRKYAEYNADLGASIDCGNYTEVDFIDL